MFICMNLRTKKTPRPCGSAGGVTPPSCLRVVASSRSKKTFGFGGTSPRESAAKTPWHQKGGARPPGTLSSLTQNALGNRIPPYYFQWFRNPFESFSLCSSCLAVVMRRRMRSSRSKHSPSPRRVRRSRRPFPNAWKAGCFSGVTRY
jgi:hypothetical protein